MYLLVLVIHNYCSKGFIFVMMKQKILYIIFLLVATNIVAQVNLVPNSSFEAYDTCPYNGSQIYFSVPWKGVTTNSTDYYNVCAVPASNCSIPSDGAGWQYARTGVAYAGLYAVNGFGLDYREYLQVKLDSTLELDSCYFVEFYCNLHNKSYFSINKLGAYLSNTAVSAVGPSTWGLVLQYTPQIVSHTFLTDTLNWMQIAGYYHAIGGEKYITIGNFDLDNPSDTLHTGYGTAYPYYLIDDVTVKKISGCDTVGVGIQKYNNDLSFNLSPNPNDGNMILKYSTKPNSKAEMKIYDVTGRLINSYKLTEGDNNTLKISEDELQNGIYFYNVIIDNKVKSQSKIVIVK